MKSARPKLTCKEASDSDGLSQFLKINEDADKRVIRGIIGMTYKTRQHVVRSSISAPFFQPTVKNFVYLCRCTHAWIELHHASAV